YASLQTNDIRRLKKSVRPPGATSYGPRVSGPPNPMATKKGTRTKKAATRPTRRSIAKTPRFVGRDPSPVLDHYPPREVGSSLRRPLPVSLRRTPRPPRPLTLPPPPPPRGGRPSR